MIRILAWTLGILFLAQPLAQASSLEAIKDIQVIANKAWANKEVKTFGQLLKAVHGADADQFVSQLPDKVRNSAVEKFEIVDNKVVFKNATLTFASNGRSFNVNGSMVTESVLSQAISKRDPSIILKHLEKISAKKPALISLINLGMSAFANEAHATSFPYGYGMAQNPASQYFQSPWMCMMCQYYGTWMGANWVAPWDWQHVYWGAMVGQIAQSRYTTLINNTTASPYGTAAVQ